MMILAQSRRCVVLCALISALFYGNAHGQVDQSSRSSQRSTNPCQSDGTVVTTRDYMLVDQDSIVQLIDSGRCAAGRQVGLWVTRYAGNGKPFSVSMLGDSTSYWSINYSPRGLVESRDSVFAQGIDEKHFSYDENGALMGSKVISKGTVHYVNYYDNGQVSSKSHRSYPSKDGESYVHRTYSVDGSLFDEIEYVDGRKEGVAKRYRPNGSLLYECTYVNGQLEGQYKKYDETGALQEVILYSGGSKM